MSPYLESHRKPIVVRSAWPALLALLVVVTLPSLAPAQESPRALADTFSVSELARTARSLGADGRLTLEGVQLDPTGPPEALDLEAFRLFAPGARVVVHGATGEKTHPVPDRRFFRGHVVGDPASLAVLAVGEDGGVRGLVQRGGEAWVLGRGRRAGTGGPRPLEARKAAAELPADRSFACGEGALPTPPPVAGAQRVTRSLETAATTTPYTARVAIETDYEFYALFNDVDAALAYIADVMAYSSTIYDREIDTDLLVPYVSLWTTPSDPWSQSNPTCALYEMGEYWNGNRTGVSRTIAHFLSAKNNGGGVAWVGVLCEGGFTTTIGTGCPGLSSTGDYYGGYGYSGDLDGNFDIDNPSIVWDIMVVSHEIGHNFSSPHTHCYAGIGGSSEPVDKCTTQSGSTCWQGSTSLPCNDPGGGCGTLMSYCHFHAPGLSNISLTFGEGHPHGVLPQRVPDQMRDHVESRASVYPGCLDRVAAACYPLTLSHAGSGADPVASPTASAGCPAGEYLDGEGIGLTASAASGWAVDGWSGTDDDGSRATTNSLTMPAAAHAADVTYVECAELVLSGETVSGTVTEESCIVRAGNGYEVVSPGDVTLRGRTVILESGFSVVSGSLAVETQ